MFSLKHTYYVCSHPSTGNQGSGRKQIPGSPVLKRLTTEAATGSDRRRHAFGKLLIPMIPMMLAVFAAQAADLPSTALLPNSSLTAKAVSHSGNKLWRSSVGAIAIAGAMDVHSSWGKRELNPTLSGNNGTISIQGALIKLGIQGGIIGIEYMVLRRHPSQQLFRSLSIINFGDAAATGAIAAHNYTIPRP